MLEESGYGETDGLGVPGCCCLSGMPPQAKLVELWGRPGSMYQPLSNQYTALNSVKPHKRAASDLMIYNAGTLNTASNAQAIHIYSLASFLINLFLAA